MALSFLKPTRCVILLGDESVLVYNVTFSGAKLVEAVSWQETDFEENLIRLIRKSCNRKPVLILNDMTDQHFKGGQRLPKVGPMDKANVLNRKIQVAFPNYPIRGALEIKQPKGAKVDGQKAQQSGMYLFSAVPMSEPVSKTMEAVAKSMAPISGFALLPVEAADMVTNLAAKLAGKKRTASRWVVFIGQHHNGALRQVITRDGQLAMTRMTPILDNDADPEAWAHEVSQEFKATISYLSRFGFSPEDGVELIVVSNQKAGEILEQLIDIQCNFTALTAPEAARVLNISIGHQEDPRYADPLHAAWVGRKSRFALPMKAPELDKVRKPRQASSLAMLLMIGGAAWLGWQFVAESQKALEVRNDISSQQRALAQVEIEYQEEVQRLANMGFDVKLIQASIKTYDYLESRRIKSVALVKAIDQALGDELWVDALQIAYVSDEQRRTEAQTAGGYDPQAVPLNPEVQATIRLKFPPTIDPEYGMREVNSLKARLEAQLPGFKVTIPKNVMGMEFSDTLSGTASRSAEEIAQEEYTAELIIRGEVK